MTDEVNAKLDAIFNARAERQAEAGRKKQEAEQQMDANLQDFLLLKEKVIIPTLEALKQGLSDRGEESIVVEVTDGEMRHGRKEDAAVGIRLIIDDAARYRDGNDYPHLTLKVEKAKRLVRFYYSTMSPRRGGTSSSDVAVGYDDVTAELINEKALKLFAAVYA